MILNVVLGARVTLLILKKALANKIPLNEDAEWELPYIIERYKRANVEIYIYILIHKPNITTDINYLHCYHDTHKIVYLLKFVSTQTSHGSLNHVLLLLEIC